MVKTTKKASTKAASKSQQKAKSNSKDTGSATAQIGVFTRRIQSLTKHLKTHKKDKHSSTGLLKLVGKRRRLLDYLKKKDNTAYQAVLKKFGLRK